MALVNQTSRLPTRKIMAVIISGMILGAVQNLLQMYWPDHPFTPYMEDIDAWLQLFVMGLAGYMTKERDNATSDVVVQTGEIQEPSGSGDSGLPSTGVGKMEPATGQTKTGK